MAGHLYFANPPSTPQRPKGSILVNHPTWLRTYVRWSLCALACAVSLGVALVSISKLLITLGFIAMVVSDLLFLSRSNPTSAFVMASGHTPLGRVRELWGNWTRVIKGVNLSFKHLRTPSAVLLALTWMALSLAWTQALPIEWPMALTRHSRLLFIPMILYCIRSKEDVLMIVRAMVLTQLAIVLYSYLLWLGVPMLHSNPLYPKDFGVVINGHLEQPIMSTLMVVLAWSFKAQLWPKTSPKLIDAICALGAFNVFFIMTGRTGFIAMLLAITLAIDQEISRRYPKYRIGVWVLPLVMACALGLLSERFNHKVIEAYHDITLYSQGNDATSQGYRLDYWKQSLKAIAESPWVGHGVGSWRQEYLVYGGNEPNPPSNPHQQFLLWSVEAGVIGLALFLNFLFSLYKDAQRLEGPSRQAMLSSLGIVLMVSMFNCPFYGAGIGEFFILIFASMLASIPSPHSNPLDLNALRERPTALSWIERLGLRVVTQPLSVKVLGNEQDYAQSEGLRKLGWRQLRKICYLQLHRQSHLEHHQAQPQWTRGLWIYQRTPQIGDSLMDLAPRDLFKSKGMVMDLMIPEHLMELFSGDTCFERIYSTPLPPNEVNYDFILVQSIHHRSLYKKIKHFPHLPWMCIQGNYDVPNFARSRFVTQRLCDLFSWPLSELEFERHAQQKLCPPKSPWRAPSEHAYPLTIAIGGMDPSRIYFQWLEVLSLLQKNGHQRCLLIGAGEYAQRSSEIMVEALKHVMDIQSLVNQVSLHECQQVLSQTQLLITADGGLMHLGVASGTQRIVSLFTKSIWPSYRLANPYLKDAIQSPSDMINDIHPQWIVDKVLDKVLDKIGPAF